MLGEAEYDLLIRAHPMFDRVPPALNKRLRQSASQVAVPGGAQVFREGDDCSNFLVVLDGIVRVSKPSEDGRELLLYYVHPGEFCVMTTACLLGGMEYEARGETVGDVVATHIPAPLFRELVHECEEFCQLVFQTMGLRMSMLMRLVEEVAFQRLDRRLATLLLQRSTMPGEGGGDGSHVHATHQELAADLGTSREIVSRTLESLESQGLVKLGRGRILLLDPTRLREVYLDRA